MKAVAGGQWSVVSSCGRLFCLLLTAYFLLACGVVNLQGPECAEARTRVREFYSFHFGNDMKFSPDNLRLREEFLTPAFVDRLRQSDSAFDPFTLTEDHPKAFRVGECRLVDPGKRVSFNVLLFWKTDTESIQRSINVDVLRESGQWLIETVGIPKSD